MSRSDSVLLILLALTATAPLHAQAPRFEDSMQPFIARHCALCHDDLEPEADLDLTRFSSDAAALAEPDIWFAVEERLLADDMPPKSEPRPPAAEVQAALAWIAAQYGSLDPETAPPGRVVLRRLNAIDYANTIRDLFDVEFDAAGFFPADAVGHGFNTVGEALSVSELTLERYLEAAELIANETIYLESRGGPTKRRYTEELEVDRGRASDGAVWLSMVGEAYATHEFPRDGEYLLRFSGWSTKAGDDEARISFRLDGKEFASFELPGTRKEPDEHEVRTRVTEGRHRLAARFMNDLYRPKEADKSRRDRNVMITAIEVVGPMDPPPLSSFQQHLLSDEIAGEGSTRRRQLRVLEHLAERVWRRPISRIELGRLERTIPEGSTLEEGVRLGLTVLLSSPNFIYRIEFGADADEGADAVPLTDWELATRLSYFLWSTTPDEELRRLAARGELSDPEVLAAQTTRLLRSPRSRALAKDFASQWLQIGVLDEAAPDKELFPEFDEALRLAMREETLRFFDHVLREQLPASTLLEADFSLLNERLAEHYGVPGVKGEMMRLVSLSDTPRRGILGHGSVLTATSNPTRTSPVRRGKWVLDAIMGMPPAPPPPGSDSLSPDTELSGATLRERFERHRENAACAVCHDRIDPIGFSLENYDPIGRWRTSTEGQPVDASGVFPDGHAFVGPAEMAAHLLLGDDFERALVKKLLVYALGRGLVRTDRGHITRILAAAGPEPSLPAMIHALIQTRAFTMLNADSTR